MPELPEVEVTRRGIDQPLRGAQVLAVRLGKPLRWPLGCAAPGLVGCRLDAVQRRGKYLWLPLLAPGGAGRSAGGLLVHLGMSGSLRLLAAPGPPGPHDHFDLVTTAGTLRLTDPRRFGAVVFAPSLDLPPVAERLRGLGVEPDDPELTAEAFHAALARRHAPIKSVLLSGSVVVGAGNIYACEALYAAGVDPRTPADRISRPRAARLLQAVRATLARAIEAGGTTLRDYRGADGSAGEYQQHCAVYGRAGEPCLRCGTPIRRIVMTQRSTYLCPRCQRR